MHLLRTSTFKRTVRCNVPDPVNADQFAEVKFVAELRLLPQAELEKITGAVESSASEAEQMRSTQAAFDRVVVNIFEIGDDGKPREPTEESKALVREHPIACAATTREAFTAIAEGLVRKNSKG